MYENVSEDKEEIGNKTVKKRFTSENITLKPHKISFIVENKYGA